MLLPDLAEPSTTAELRASLLATHEASTRVWSQLEAAERFSPQGDAWSPAQHLEHLEQSNRPVAYALGLPKPILLLRFGPALRRSRSFVGVRELYTTALANGLRASGRFVPRAAAEVDDPAAHWRAMLEKRQKLAERLDRQIAAWSERALDRLRLPHPGLGKMTVREMLLFTLYHNHYHARVVAERSPSLA